MSSQNSISSISFNGSGSEYFKIWIVNIGLSILTLGIYSAWAKVRSKRYFYGNTELDQAVFEYHATPMMILKGRLIAVCILVLISVLGQVYPVAQLVAFIILVGITPWIIWRSLIFNARMASYRNVRFSFIGKLPKLYIFLVLLPLTPLLVAGIIIGVMYVISGNISPAIGPVILLVVLSIYLLGPYVQHSMTTYYLNHHRFGQSLFKAKLNVSIFYKIYIKLFLISFGLSLVFSIILGTIFFFAKGIPDRSEILNPENIGMLSILINLLGVLVLLPIIFFAKAYLHTRVRNYTYSQLNLVPGITFNSSLEVKSLLWIFISNTLLIICTLGLAYPWAIVRLIKYKVETLSVNSENSLDGFVTQMQSRQAALGDELGEAFDIDLDLAI